MHCKLLDLAAELQLMIIEEPRQDEDIEALADYEDDDHHEEIKIHHDLINWSYTSSYFHNLLAPYIVKTVKLLNGEKSGSSLNPAAKSPHNAHIKELRFIGSAFGNARSEEATFSDTEGILPGSVKALLCDLQQFPNLERLSIEFNFNFESMEWISEGMKIGRGEETPDEALKAEASVAWRALMSRT